MNILKKSCFSAVSLATLLTCGHALAAVTPENSPVPIQVEVAQDGVSLLEMKGVIQHSAKFKLSQPGSRTVKTGHQKQLIDTYSEMRLNLDVADTTRSTVTLAVYFSDSTVVNGYAPKDVTKGAYETASVFVLERGKPFKHEYNLCLDAAKPWCKGALNITVE